MTTEVTENGQVVLPRAILMKMHLHEGDVFEVCIEDEDTVTLRRISRPANRGLVDLLLGCPAAFDIPGRARPRNPVVSPT